jgi:hypothetical protein
VNVKRSTRICSLMRARVMMWGCMTHASKYALFVRELVSCKVESRDLIVEKLNSASSVTIASTKSVGL